MLSYILLILGFTYIYNYPLHIDRNQIDNIKNILYNSYMIVKTNGVSNTLSFTKQIMYKKLSEYLIEVHDKYYIINYPYGISWYKILVPRKRGPCLIDDILDENKKSIMSKVEPFMGPSYNFHNTNITPEYLGYECIYILKDDEEIKFDKKSVLKIE